MKRVYTMLIVVALAVCMLGGCSTTQCQQAQTATQVALSAWNQAKTAGAIPDEIAKYEWAFNAVAAAEVIICSQAQLPVTPAK